MPPSGGLIVEAGRQAAGQISLVRPGGAPPTWATA